MNATNKTPTYYDISEISSLGWFQITDIGEENVYFTTADGSKGYWKFHG